MVDQSLSRAPPASIPLQGRPRTGSERGPGPFPVILVLLYIGYVVFFIILPRYTDVVPEDLLAGFEPLYRLITAGVLFLIVAALLIFSFSRRRSDLPGSSIGGRQTTGGAGQQGEIRKFRPVSQAEQGQPKVEPPVGTPPKIFIYPKEVEGGIYGDTYISIDDMKVMKLRSLVVEPEHLS